ncbi:MAG: hypothetical protein JWP97_741 [Labilithrix sp.]|nr:hypothetical protein [Labilithrix sp.]
MTEPRTTSAPPAPTVRSTTSGSHELAGVIETADEGDRPSITDVNGSIAKFEMAYSPARNERFAFGPPLLSRIPGYLFLVFAACIGLSVLAAYYGSSNSRLYVWVVEGDRHRVFGSGPLAFIILFAAIGNVIKNALRGVVVTGDAIESRTLLAGFPKVKRYTWAQVDRVVVDNAGVMLELWNGEYDKLPRVADDKKLADLLASIATARGRQVTRLE